MKERQPERDNSQEKSLWDEYFMLQGLQKHPSDYKRMEEILETVTTNPHPKDHKVSK